MLFPPHSFLPAQAARSAIYPDLNPQSIQSPSLWETQNWSTALHPLFPGPSFP